MNDKYKIKYSTMISFFYAMFAFWSLSPYFTWNTYMNGILGRIGFFPVKSIWAILCIGVSIIYMFKKEKIETHIHKSAFLMILIIAFMLICCGGTNNSIFDTAWLAYIAIFVLLLLPKDIQKQTLNIFAVIFTVFLIIPIITFILTEVFKINIPFSVLHPQDSEKVNIGVFYKHRFLSVQFAQNALKISRFNGIYYEAGVVGTICALLLGAYSYEIFGKNTWKQKLWLLCGICSFSLSFILFSVLFFGIKNLCECKIKNVFTIFFIILVYFVFISINFSNPMLQSIQKRVTFDGNRLQGDNRVSQGYSRAFNDFNDGNIFNRLFGYGRDSFAKLQNEMKFDGSSYKSIIYDYGYLGFALYVFWFFYIINYVAKKYNVKFKEFVPILIMQLANIYQKPDVFAIYYIIIFIGGIIFIIEKEKNDGMCNKCDSINL